ncbi:hypothetical protein LCGC14_0723810 [marine sediment metagenome]|uniref:Uncharacterized protein n=1 Tax=marine sediment metagenome TaxID=412755 RepID=A0A0F9QBN6_9ZZZZ
MSKIGLSVSMIGGILFFILTYIFARWYYSLWKLDTESVLMFYFFLLANGGAIVGALLGFLNKSWQLGKNRKIESVKVGRILCFLAGFSLPLWLLIRYVGMKPPFFPYIFEDFFAIFYINIPELLLSIGGITGMIEWQLERRKNKFAQEEAL